MHNHFKTLFKDLDIKMDNQGDKLVITIHGDKEQLKTVEKKLSAIHELCCGDGECGCNCC